MPYYLFFQPNFSRLTSIKKIVYGVIFVSSPKFTQEKYRWLDISPYSNLCVLIQRVDLTYKKNQFWMGGETELFEVQNLD